jgi:hypothetical protein
MGHLLNRADAIVISCCPGRVLHHLTVARTQPGSSYPQEAWFVRQPLGEKISTRRNALIFLSLEKQRRAISKRRRAVQAFSPSDSQKLPLRNPQRQTRELVRDGFCFELF